ncbi:MAG TPA: hypothetical protein VFY89_03755, partial [Ktedonobacterales bacterium]
MNPANPQQPNAATTRTAQHRQVLSPLNLEARRSPGRARQIVTQVYVQLQADIDAFTAPPDIWHNFAILADRIGMEAEESLILRAALREWQHDVDLLCDHLQNAFNSGSVDYNPTLAAQYWERLEKLPRTVTAPYWRFWTFGAQYHMRITRDLTRAKNLLDEGLRYVQRDGLENILRSYRALLVDSEPLRPIRDEQDLIAYQEWAFSLLESRYKLGIQLGVENGYVLAGELAKLYQERAGARLAATPNASQAQQRQEQNRNEDLEQALIYLRLAEALYTGNSNHPIQAI